MRGGAFREYDSDGLDSFPQVLTDYTKDIKDTPQPPPERRGRLLVPLAVVRGSFGRLPVVLSKVVALSLAPGGARSAQPAWAGLKLRPPKAAAAPPNHGGAALKNIGALMIILFKDLNSTPPLLRAPPRSLAVGGLEKTTATIFLIKSCFI
jgi:hypothetical protein